jgi:hypothetical protein
MQEEPLELYKSTEELELPELKKEIPKAYKKVNCPSCNEEIGADNLNLQLNVGKCGSCNAIFSIEEDVKAVMGKQLMKQDIIRPEGIDLFYYKDDLDITINKHLQGLDAVGTFILPSFSFLSIILYFAKGIPVLFPVILTLASLYFIFKAFNYSKRNKTLLNINNRILSIKSHPRNLTKDKSYNSGEIDQVYIKHAADGSGYYSIHMIINGIEGQKHEKLLTVNSLSKAKFLEQEIERYLGIEDRKVPESIV